MTLKLSFVLIKKKQTWKKSESEIWTTLSMYICI